MTKTARPTTRVYTIGRNTTVYVDCDKTQQASSASPEVLTSIRLHSPSSVPVHGIPSKAHAAYTQVNALENGFPWLVSATKPTTQHTKLQYPTMTRMVKKASYHIKRNIKITKIVAITYNGQHRQTRHKKKKIQNNQKGGKHARGVLPLARVPETLAQESYKRAPSKIDSTTTTVCNDSRL